MEEWQGCLQKRYVRVDFMKKVAIFRDSFPMYSETFVANHGKYFSRYEKIMLTRKKIQDTLSLDVNLIELNNGFLVDRLFFDGNFVFSKKNAYLDAEISKCSILHAHFAQDGLLASGVAKHYDLPLIVSTHGSDVTLKTIGHIKTMRILSMIYVFKKNLLLDRARLFLSPSNFIKRVMIKNGFPEKKIITNYIGVDVEYYCPSKKISPHRSEYILCVARHSEVKGIDVLIKAFSEFCKKNKDVDLILIGDGYLIDRHKSMVENYKLGERVFFLGAQPPNVVRSYMQSCIFNVLPSRKAKDGAEEGFGLVLLETQACGRPCIGTNIGGIGEAINPDKTGLIVKSDCVSEMYLAIDYFCENRAVVENFGSNGRDWVVQNFSKNVSDKKLEDIYDAILS